MVVHQFRLLHHPNSTIIHTRGSVRPHLLLFRHHHTLVDFWRSPLNSFASRCLVGPFNVCLALFQDCNAKDLKCCQDASAPVIEGLTLTKCRFLLKADATFRYFGGCESTKNILVEELRSVLSLL